MSESFLEAPGHWINRINVWVIGAGGNGGEVVDALSQFTLALQALGHNGLNVTIIDDARVREVNLVRQRFWVADIGQYKSITLANRYNLLLGTQWTGVPMRFEDMSKARLPDLIISAVDVASARRHIRDRLVANASQAVWLDFGNNASNGQAIIGIAGDSRYPTVIDHYPEIETLEDDTTKSCSTAEAIAAQDCLINRAVSTAGMSMVWDLLRKGATRNNGVIVDLCSGNHMALPFPDAAANDD